MEQPGFRPPDRRQQIAGWTAVGFSTILTSTWAFWGAIENFHEGWYHDSLLSNLGLMLLQYLSPMLIFMVAARFAIYHPRLGGVLHGLIGLVAIWFFDAFSNAATFLIILPLGGLAALYWFGRPQPKRRAAWIAIGLPVLTLLMSGAAPAFRVSQRLDDGSRQAVQVAGNGVALIWAPAGAGWPDEGADWTEAQRACRYLSADGANIENAPQDIWHLPTVDEAVRSMALHGVNSGGVWNADTGQAAYETRPDKESPLWDVHSQVIYWWTATEVDTTHAYIIVYDGKVWARDKDFGPAHLGFRCVK